MTSRIPTSIIVTIFCLGAINERLRSDVIEFWNDTQGWTSAVRTHDSIDFIEHEAWTIITDQYQHMGVTFSNIVFIHNAPSYTDGWGLSGNDGIRINFETPQHAFAIDHLGQTSYKLFYKGELVVQMSGWFSYALPGPVYFSGIISDQRLMKCICSNPNHLFQTMLLVLTPSTGECQFLRQAHCRSSRLASFVAPAGDDDDARLRPRPARRPKRLSRRSEC